MHPGAGKTCPMRKSTRPENPKKDPLANPVSVSNPGILLYLYGNFKREK
jgi:hypothetical protein